MAIFGIDISNYQGGLDLAQVRSEGFDFVFCKVSEGSGYQDPTWPGFRDAARANGLILAGYHYVTDSDDPAAQAQTFVSHLGDNSIAAMLDFEANSGNMDVFWAVVRAINNLGVQVRLSYIPRWYWQQIGSPDLSQVPGEIQSAYVDGGPGFASALYPGDDSWRWTGFGNTVVDVLQFTDKAQVAGFSVDADAFRGARDDLNKLLGYAAEAAPQEDAMTPELIQMITSMAEQTADIQEQLRGPGEKGWPQLGQNSAGQDLTLVDAVSSIQTRLTSIEQTLATVVAHLEPPKQG